MKKYIGKPTEYVALIVGNLIYALGFNLFLAQPHINTHVSPFRAQAL